MSTLEVIRAPERTHDAEELLRINAPLVTEWLVEFLRDEMIRRRGFHRAVVGLSGGVDSSVTAFLCARALGPENVWG
ncbi:MAG: NAD(+) synthetase, partial [bacterium]|nr:NAD(+) synthetase [bacterium]